MSIITNVFSALGNNSTLYPIIFKDAMDNTGRVVMAYNEGAKGGKKFAHYDARERFIEENATSLVWIGGIPALKLVYDRLVTNKIYKFANIENLGSTFDKKGKRVLANTNLNLLDENGTQNLKKNIDSIREAAKNNKTLQKLVEEADKILENPTKFKKIQAGRMAVSTLLPLAMVGFILPKLIQKLTKSIYKNDKNTSQQQNTASLKNKSFKGDSPVFSTFKGGNKSLNAKNSVFSKITGNNTSKQQVSFKGKIQTAIVNIFNNDVYNQAILDGGISGGRIITGVNAADKIEKGIKEAGVVFFIYLGGRIVANFLEKVGRKLGMPISLDSQILEDENFHKSILNIADAGSDVEKNTLKQTFLQFEGNDEKSILAFVDKQIETGVENNKFKNVTLKAAQKLGIVDLVEGVKNPLQKINTNDLKGLNESLKEFVEKALSKGSPEEVEKFLKKALNTKRGSIVLNLAICSISTAYLLPKLQYLFREKFTKSSNLPSLAEYDKQIEQEKTKA